MDLKDHIRTIPDYPQKGIMFRDVTTLMQNGPIFREVIEAITDHASGLGVNKIAGIDARGFIFGAPVAARLEVGFVPLRKAGKLPAEVFQEKYELEYGTDILEMHIDAVDPYDSVLLVDDLIATGGTAMAAINLLRRANADVTDAAFVVGLPELGGTDKLSKMDITSMVLATYDGH